MALGSLLIIPGGIVCRSSPVGVGHPPQRFLQRGAPLQGSTGAHKSRVPGTVGRAGLGCHSQVSAAASVGMVGVVVGVVLVEVVVVEARMVRVRHVARMMEVAKVSQVALAREEARLGPADAVSPGSRSVPLHIHPEVLLSAAQAGGQQQQQEDGHSSTNDQTHEA